MPFRRREQSHQIAFEAVDDLDDGDDLFAPRPSGPDAPTGRPGTPPDDVAPAVSDGTGASGGADGVVENPRDPRARRRRRLVATGAAGALVLVLGGLTALDMVRAREADALLRTLDGGVVGLTQPPEEVWSVETGQARATFAGDRLVLAHADALEAYDLATGEVSWKREDLAGFQCGVGGPSPAMASRASSVTCLGGGGPVDVYPREPSTTVAVVGLDGELLARRDLDPSRGISEVLPDGDLARAVREGRDLVVTVEDARTGEARWATAVPQVERAEGGGSCDVVQEDGTTVDGRDDLYFFDVAGGISVAGCDVAASFTAQGELLEADLGLVRSLRDGRFVRSASDGVRTEVLDTDGVPLWSIEGFVIEPLATDGTAPPLLYVQGGSGIVALDEDGRESWTFPRYTTQVLLATKSLTVVASYPGAVAVDNATGEELWTWKASENGGSSTSDVTVAFAGRGALTIVVGVEPVERTRWTSIDLADGSTRWNQKIPVDAYTLMTFDGRPYSLAHGKVTAFG